MENKVEKWRRGLNLALYAAVLIVAAEPVMAAGPLSITSPTPGQTFVHTDQVTVSVQVDAPVAGEPVGVRFVDETGGSVPLSAPPYVFQLGLLGGSIGPRTIEASCVRADGTIVSDRVTISVAAGADLTRLEVQPAQVQVEPGKKVGLYVEGVFANGSRYQLSDAGGGTQYSLIQGSSDVATVSSEGIVTAGVEGSAIVQVQNGSILARVPVMVKRRAVVVAGQLLSGKKATLKDASDPGKKKLLIQSTDAIIGLGGADGSGDDPVATEANSSVRVRTSNGCNGPCDSTYQLTATWSYIGKPGQNKGYKYSNRTGPITSVRVQPGKQVKIVGKGASLSHKLGTDPKPVYVVLRIGEQRYCMKFGGTTAFKVGQTFAAKNAPRAPVCPP